MFTPVNIHLMSIRAPYHHGDLRNALIGAAAELAEQGGPDAVTIRAAARIAGVTPTAAYRHFAGQEELLSAAKERSRSRMATAMHKRLEALPDEADPARAAVARLEATGRGYVDFALSEPGLFRTAFCSEPVAKGIDLAAMDEMEKDGAHALLVDAVDRLLEQGFFEPAQRMGVEIASWSVVHGLSFLLLDGPLARLPEQARQPIIEQTFDAFLGTLWTSRASLQNGR